MANDVMSLKGDFSTLLLGKDGVEGVGVGLADLNDKNRGPAVVIYVRDDSARAAMLGAPAFQTLASKAQNDGVAVRIEVSGPFFANAFGGDGLPAWAFEPMAGHPEYSRRIRPVPPGYSVGLAQSSGSVGLVVINSPERTRLFIASNCHVLNGNNDSAYYETIQPGGADGGISGRDAIGRADRYVQIKPTDNYMDAATSLPNGNAILEPSYPTVGALPGHYQQYSVGWNFYKVGRTTGAVRSRVDSVHTDTLINYGTYGSLGTVGFKDQTVILSDQAVSLPGDSGSIWLRDEDKYACAVNYAGSSDGRRSISFPFNWFAQVFKVVVARRASGKDIEAGHVISPLITTADEAYFTAVLTDSQVRAIAVAEHLHRAG